MRRLMKLILPAAAGAGAVQINLVVSTALAGALLAEGSISYIYYADRLNQLPLGMIGIGLGTILLPTISRLLGAGQVRPRRWRRRIAASSWRCSSRFPPPSRSSSRAEPIVRGLFQHGQFTAEDTGALRLGARRPSRSACLPMCWSRC